MINLHKFQDPDLELAIELSMILAEENTQNTAAGETRPENSSQTENNTIVAENVPSDDQTYYMGIVSLDENNANNSVISSEASSYIRRCIEPLFSPSNCNKTGPQNSIPNIPHNDVYSESLSTSIIINALSSIKSKNVNSENCIELENINDKRIFLNPNGFKEITYIESDSKESDSKIYVDENEDMKPNDKEIHSDSDKNQLENKDEINHN